VYWQIINPTPTQNLSPEKILHLLLKNRGVNESMSEEFLNPQVNQQLVSQLLSEAELVKAEGLVNQAIRQNRPIVIHGDYDVDGICATAILWETLYRRLNYPLVRPLIPHREKHGYGISTASLQEVKKVSRSLSVQPPLLITVDCGISSAKELEKFRHDGGQVILTDHHLPPARLPSVDALLHTTELSGAGVAWLLSARLLNSSAEEFLELVSLATVADCVPLTGYNRGLVAEGLKILSQTARPGLQELYQLAKIDGKEFTPYHLGWLIGPRLNASGRLGHALDSLRLLATHNRDLARQLAQHLEELNSRRQDLTMQATSQAEKMVDTEMQNILVLTHSDWPEGIIGLIAAKVTEKFFLPSLAISQKEEVSKGSARSIKGFNIVDFLHQADDLLIGCGGHAMAAGFSLRTKHLDEFRQRVQELGQKETSLRESKPVLKIDLELELPQAGLELVDLLKKLEPHGIGNPSPVFASRQVRAFNIRTVGSDGRHLKLNLQDPETGTAISAIGFSLGHLNQEINEGESVDVAYQLEENDYFELPSVEAKIKDIRK